MADQSEAIKKRYGNPYDVLKVFERAAAQGETGLSEDDLFMAKWVGLYTHRHERDYFMLRTKQPNGFVTPEQLDTVADITEKQNKGYADITTRQDFQLHWVHVTQAAAILKRLESVGISTRGACGDVLRNVVGCPVAGVDKEELFDTGPIAKAVSDFFLGNPAYSDLPRKYKIGIMACRSWCAHPEIQCVALTGTTRLVNGKTLDLGELTKDKKMNVIAKQLDLVEFFESDELVETVKKLEKLGVEVEDYNPQKIRAVKGKEQAKSTRYKIEKKDETPVYFESLAEVLKFIQGEGKKGMSIQRYKGLGEMNPEQLWETTMAPDKRTILRVDLEDAVEADKMFTTLMGDEVEPRREFIHKYAREVRNLDI